MRDLDKNSVHLTHKVWVIYNTHLPSVDFWPHHYSLLKTHAPPHPHTWISNHVTHHRRNLNTSSNLALIIYYGVGYLGCFPIITKARFVVMVEDWCVCFCLFYPSGSCCPLGVKLYRLVPNGIRIYWQASRGSANYSTDLYGSKGIFTCAPSAGLSFCDITEIPCGDVYTVMVSPVAETGLKLTFCPKKIYSGRTNYDPLFKTSPQLNLWIKTQNNHTYLLCRKVKEGMTLCTSCRQILATGDPKLLWNCDALLLLDLETLLSSLSLFSPSEKGPDACCLNSKADLKWFSALRFGDRFVT